MSKCTCNNCELETFNSSDKCILHIEKNGYSSDFDNAGLLHGFYRNLLNYIIDYIFLYKKEDDEINKETVKENLESTPPDVVDGVTNFINKSNICFDQIAFPGRDSRDPFDYFNLLRKLKSIYFKSCDFKIHSLELTETRCFYQNCNFFDNWYLSDSLLLDNIGNALYHQCIFHNEVQTNNEVSDRNYEINIPLFNNCKFKEKISFFNTDFSEPIFSDNNQQEVSIKEFSLSRCNVNEKFTFNGFKIGLFLLSDSVFNGKFEFKSNTVKDFKIFNTNFLKLVDAYESKFNEFIVKKSIFEEFVGFEKCIFGLKNKNSNKYTAIFLYATFLSFINFRNTTFHGGLDLENINLKESPNFLNTTIEPEYTNRETFRIIKNSFDKIGNHIEANKFFVQEMKKYKEWVKNKSLKQERIILFFNEIISDFGQSYIKPAMWVFVFSILYSLLVFGYENSVLYSMYYPANIYIENTAIFLNEIAKNILPFSKFLKTGMEFVSLIFYIIFASLIWQFIVSVKRHTKR